MSSTVRNTFRLEKHKCVPLLSFGGGKTRDTTSDGWHGSPYGAPGSRTMGLQFTDPNGVVQAHQVAFRGDVYQTYDTQAGWKMGIKFDLSRLTSIWYRYRWVNGFLQPFSAMPNLRVLSIREHNTHFGHLDLSGNPKFSHLDVSTHFSTRSYLGGSISQITFHPDAPLKFVYLSDCVVPVSVVDACLTQCYNMRNVPAPDGIQQTNSFTSQRVKYSPGLQYMVDELKNNYGWVGFGSY